MSHAPAELRQVLARPPRRVPLDGARRAAVAALLTPADEVVFMRRSERVGDPWSGHLSFPGGHLDPGDPDALAAAVRETDEELGLRLSPDLLLGELDELRTISALPSLVIRPFVFALAEPPTFRTNHEVAGVHLLPLPDLLSNRGRSSFVLEWSGFRRELPCVDFDGVRLWGLTLAMVDDLLDRIDGGGRGLARGGGGGAGAE